MRKDYFISSIGYDGAAAVVDKKRASAHKDRTLNQLIEAGAFRSAAALAVYNKSDSDMEAVLDAYNKLAGSHYKKEHLCKLFGIHALETKKLILL